jgi:putative protease
MSDTKTSGHPADAIELLSPARDLECGLAAIDCGADAVYIGAPRFGARSKAANSIEDIAKLAAYAHKYRAKIYITLNTILFDYEIAGAVQIASEVYKAGADGLIIQDLALLEADLPPLPLIASTQMHNTTPQRVQFLQAAGFRRAILARELSLDQIREIRQAVNIELEVFIHGALCVCYSGQCYLSYALGGRSANRGECAQPCRKSYNLVDDQNRVLIKERHLLSLKDLNLSAYMDQLLDAGIVSFKIEGRMKDRSYVMNVVSHYRRLLDQALLRQNRVRSSDGCSRINFDPDITKTFNRGYTSYFLKGADNMGSPDTSKMVGETIGQVSDVQTDSFTLIAAQELHNGDGLSFFDGRNVLTGTAVNRVDGNRIFPASMREIRKGLVIYRNHDHQFIARLQKAQARRKIYVNFILRQAGEMLTLEIIDEYGIRAAASIRFNGKPAQNEAQMRQKIDDQLRRTGDTEFERRGLQIELNPLSFIPVSFLNDLRRNALNNLRQKRLEQRPVLDRPEPDLDYYFPESQVTFLANIINEQAREYYRRHGAEAVEPGAETGLDMRGRKVMTTKYCIKRQIKMCPLQRPEHITAGPLYLEDSDGRRLELRFNCAACEMDIYLAP